MRKNDEMNDPKSCLNIAAPDELVFVLLGRDEAAPAAIRAWVDARIIRGKNSFMDAQIQGALDCADNMEKARRDATIIRNVPDSVARQKLGEDTTGLRGYYVCMRCGVQNIVPCRCRR